MQTRCSGRLGAVFNKLSGIIDDLKPKFEGGANHPPVHLAAGSWTIGSFVNTPSAH
jgi:hypothetical protein